MRLISWCVVGLAVVAAVGCGSSSDGSGSGGSPNGGTSAGGSGGASSGGTSTGGSGGTSSGGGPSGGTSAGGAAGAGGTPSGGAAGAGGGSSGGAAGSAGASTGGTGGTGGASSAIKTVFVIVLENKAWCEISGSADAPYINNVLLPNAAFASNYTGPSSGNLHPSEPNYIWMEAGDNLGVTTDDDPAKNHQATKQHLATYLDKIGVSWRSYQEDISGTDCPLVSVNHYKPKHNPNVFFDDSTNTNDASYQYCIDHNRPLTELDADLKSGKVAQYNFVTPNMCNDMHDTCAPLNNSIKQGDEWLKLWIPKIQASSQYQNNGAIFVTWDEAESTITGLNLCCILGNCPIGMLALSPLAKSGTISSTAYDHSSLLKSVQEIFGSTPLLGHAADASTADLKALFTSFP